MSEIRQSGGAEKDKEKAFSSQKKVRLKCFYRGRVQMHDLEAGVAQDYASLLRFLEHTHHHHHHYSQHHNNYSTAMTPPSSSSSSSSSTPAASSSSLQNSSSSLNSPHLPLTPAAIMGVSGQAVGASQAASGGGGGGGGNVSVASQPLPPTVAPALSMAVNLGGVEGGLVLRYRDEEGDEVTLAGQEDLRIAWARARQHHWNHLKLCLYDVAPPVSATTHHEDHHHYHKSEACPLETTKVRMKVFVKEEIRMVEFDVGCIAALTAALERSFGKFQTLKYRDEEGDLITVRTQQELDLALHRYISEKWSRLEVFLQSR